ncbi:jg3492 [Pararge aegeria aegeria]|uniref:Jg3492 protein n=1 Tax=Pararge aegeria aegeria TaxID=348720 RepID=A0A8S4SF88_9NEOP|nr:jg3492 [Pararge aegeria aegeria]
MRIAEDPSCPECGEVETSFHFIDECPMYALVRWELQGKDSFSVEDLANLSIGVILRFTKETALAQHYHSATLAACQASGVNSINPSTETGPGTEEQDDMPVSSSILPDFCATPSNVGLGYELKIR